MTYEVLNVFPHDPQAFTQGLVYYQGFLYESTGLYGESSLRRVDLESGEVLDQVDLPDEKVADRLKQILELADLVKFAKMEPLPDENDLSLMNAYFFVNQTKYEEPKTTEEQAKEMKESSQ